MRFIGRFVVVIAAVVFVAALMSCASQTLRADFRMVRPTKAARLADSVFLDLLLVEARLQQARHTIPSIPRAPSA